MSRTVLVTGAAGVIGRAVGLQLRDSHVIGTVHSDRSVPEVDEVVVADLEAPRLGLSDAQWHDLAERIDVIVHSGGLTEWGQPRERYRAVNIEGTRTVVDLARLAGAPVHLVSTCFVHAIELGRAGELSSGNVVAPYIWSKLEGERLLQDSGVPYTVFRPTNLVGDSRTGASHRPQIVQRLSDWICRGKAPYFPAHPGNLVDVVALDTTAVSIARAVELGEEKGRLYWQTYGPAAMTVDEAQQILVEHARSLGRDLTAPPVVDPSGPLPVPLERVPPISRSFVKVLIDVSEVTRACGGILPTSLGDLHADLGVPAVSDRDAYRRSLRYWAGQRTTAQANGPDTTREAT